jgi:alpha-1,2-mannosyltransferase
VTNATREPSGWIKTVSSWLTLRRIRAHAVILAICLWGVSIYDYSVPGIFDRAGNIKFQDFLPTYVAAKMLASGHADLLYDEASQRQAIRMTVGSSPNVALPYLYGPQVARLFVPITALDFLPAAAIWSSLSVVLFLICVFLLARCCRDLKSRLGTVILCATAFPPLFHVFVRGQNSALVVVIFTAAFLAFRAYPGWLGGALLGLLIFKPQFFVTIPLLFLFAGSWSAFTAMTLSGVMQLALVRFFFGSVVTHSYAAMLFETSRWLTSAELKFAPIQMHSLRSFWSLLVPSSGVALVLYGWSAIAVLGLAAQVWKAPCPLSLRFSTLVLAAVLVDPHLFVYDLLALAPAIMLIADWSLSYSANCHSRTMGVLVYLGFVVPLLGPLSRWTHLQLSVPLFVVMLWILWKISRTAIPTAGHKLASIESRVV